MPFTADGKLFYRVTGREGKAVVFLHGAAGSGLLFGNQFQAFRDHAVCFFLDLPGHGASRRFTVNGALTMYTDSVINFIRELDVPVTLLGHSMGGAVALDVALSRPELLNGLILAGTGCRFPVGGKILNWLEAEYDHALDRIAHYCFSDSVDPDLLQTAKAQMVRTPPDVVRADFQACAAFNRCERVREIKVPALIIAGEKDKMTPPELARELAASISTARLEVISGGSHLAMLEQPDEFNEVMAKTFRKTD
jgi:pimeloyl-ACP methyl ester carboxylesterase